MLKITESCADTTDINIDYDAMSDILNSLRINGSILLHENYAPPWALTIPDFKKLRVLLGLGRGVRVIAFHFVQRGYIEITLDNGQSPGTKTIVEAGELAVCFGGAAHQISQGQHPKSMSVEKLLTGTNNPFQPDTEYSVHNTSLVCGVFLMHDVELNPLFTSLPALLQTSATHNVNDNNLSVVLNRMTQELDQQASGSSYIVERLLELLCAETLRSQLESLSQTSGWFKGLRDPVVGRAIAMIHSQPGDHWSIERLANGVAMSPSRFTARFTAAMGISPMAYVAKWRMNVASRLLQRSQQTIQEIATTVGYENLSAFNRAFKKHVGVTPATLRSRRT